ncbi:aldehyde dehydrogenase [Escherichia coli]|nr:aldehyde dehydrogenase [Escherichia coli]
MSSRQILEHYNALTYPLHQSIGNDSNLLIVFYVQIMPGDFVMQLHRF